jgi:hypothetical protein
MKSAKAAEEASVKSQIAAHATAPAAVPKKSGGIVGIAVGIAVILVAAVIGAKVFMGGRKPPRVDPSNGGPASGNNGAAQQPNLEARARDLYYSASNWEKANRGSYDESMRRYREVIVNCDGTKYADRASKDIARLRAAKETDAMAGVLASLDGKVRPYIARHEYERAISIFETYSGVAAAETKAERDKP